VQSLLLCAEKPVYTDSDLYQCKRGLRYRWTQSTSVHTCCSTEQVRSRKCQVTASRRKISKSVWHTLTVLEPAGEGVSHLVGQARDTVYRDHPTV